MNERFKGIIQHDPLREIHVGRPPAGILIVYDRQNSWIFEAFRSGDIFISCLLLHIALLIDPDEDHITQ